MKKRFTEAQIIGFLLEAASALPLKDLCRRHGFPDSSNAPWCSQFGRRRVSAAKCLKKLALEHNRWNKLLAVSAPRDVTARHAHELLLHECQAHQIELARENESLRQALAEFEAVHSSYAELYEFAPVAYLILTPNGFIAHANSAGEVLLGVDRQKLLQHRFLQFIAPADQEHWHRHFLDLQQQKGGQQVELSLKREDGSLRHVLLDSHGFISRGNQEGRYKRQDPPVVSYADNILLFIAARDITDRRQAEKALMESQNFAVGVIDSLDENIAVLDENGIITAVNKRWRRFAAENGSPDLGQNGAIGKNYFSVCSLPPSDADSASAAAAMEGIQAVLSGTMESFTTEYSCHSPVEQRWFEMRVRPLQSLRPSVVVVHKDITARVRFDAAIRLRDAALEASATAILTTDRHGTIVWANKAFSVLSGYTDEEVLGRTPGALSNSGKHDVAVFEDLWRTILAGEVWQGELINRRKNGSLYHEYQTITPVRDERGAIGQFIAVKQDISDRKKLEADLSDSEERYRMIVDMNEHAIFVFRPDDASTLAANPAACRMFGYSEADLCKQGRAGIMDVSDPAWEVLLAYRSRAGHAHGQARCIRRNGEVFPTEISFILFRDSKGQQRGIAYIRDISEPMRAEKALRESEMRWQFAVESHGDAMWDWDAEKDALFLTPAAKELFNLPDTDSARPIADFLAQICVDDRALAQRQIDDIVLGRRTEWVGEYRFSRDDETPRWIATRGRVMTRAADGRPHRIVSISSDVTCQKARQDEARRQRELVAQQARLVLLGELASALAHEINQPLTAIAGFSSACARKLTEAPEALELVQAIETQAMRAGEIAWRMRGFARRQRIGRGALSLHEVVSAVAKWIRLDGAFLNAVINVDDIASDLPMVLADRVELEQVLVNLVRNGVEASLPNVGEKPIAIAANLGANVGEIEVRVADRGCGLPVTTDFDAFKPFASTKDSGLGLGLTISYSIIEGHGGHLWATSNPGGGTIFHFTLPIAEQGVPPQAREISLGQHPPPFSDE